VWPFYLLFRASVAFYRTMRSAAVTNPLTNTISSTRSHLCVGYESTLRLYMLTKKYGTHKGKSMMPAFKTCCGS